MTETLPLVDLSRMHDSMEPELTEAWSRVLSSGSYVLGEETRSFEQEFAAHEGSEHGVACASGSDALYLALRALTIGPGGIVATVANSFVATAESIVRTGAELTFVDVDEASQCMDPADLYRLLYEPGAERLRALIPVHLYGQRTNIAALRRVLDLAGRSDIEIIVDAAQAHGSPSVAAETPITTYSFYPAKNLGALGDGGMVLTSDESTSTRIRAFRNHGRTEKHAVAAVGLNSRFDETQAAVLRAKLPHLKQWNSQRRSAADRYRRLLDGAASIQLPTDSEGHVYHLFVVLLPAEQRDQVAARLKEQGIETGLHYPVPVHQLGPYPCSRPLPVTESLCARVLSLPLFPGIEAAEIERVCSALRAALQA